MPVPRLEERTIKVLAGHIPSYLRFDNPIDTGGTLTVTPAGWATLEAVAEDENTSVLVIPVTGVFPGMIEPLARDVVRLHRDVRKPVLVIWATPIRDNDGYRMLCENGVPLFHSITAGVRGAKALLDYRRVRPDTAARSGCCPRPTPGRTGVAASGRRCARPRRAG